ncbi:hypothetical protein O0235_02565 [Tepidiforma flava]|uniref:Uncharacterized protein n=1 Tax=Tepidiforma flava TaxID=3004094 RepID=A0ABY7M7F2_9CHLR|nr:hypothetical protein [Tepidiforma flava]WBL36470.1 hypothetical protein O0235_02565 [Tepidiforma flava]
MSSADTPSAARAVTASSPDGDAGHEDGRHADADGDGLAVLAAGPAAVGEAVVVGDAGDFREDVGAVADEHDVLEGRGDPAVLDEVGLGDGEDEIAVGDIDLAAGVGDGVDAAVDGADDVLRGVLAGEHEGIGHAGHDVVLEGLAAAGAGRRDAEVAGGDFVLEVGAQDTVFDEDVAAGGVAFVIDVDGAAGGGDGAVIDDGDEGARDGLADAAGVVARALAVEVGFEAVADGFVEEDAAVAGGEDDGEGAGGGLRGVLLEDGLAGGFARELLGGRDAVEVFDAHAAAAALPGDLPAFAALGEGGDVEADEGLDVADDLAVAAGDEDVLQLVADGGIEAGDGGVEGPGGAVGAFEEGDLGGGRLGGKGMVDVVVRRAGEEGVASMGGAVRSPAEMRAAVSAARRMASNSNDSV